MQTITITRGNGNVPRTLEGMDYVSGFIFYINADVPAGWQNEPVKAFTSASEARDSGLNPEGENVNLDYRTVYYHISEFFRINPGATLYVGMYKKAGGTEDFTEVETLQTFAGGEIRQVAVWNGYKALSADHVTKLQAQASALEQADAPLVILYSPLVQKAADLLKEGVKPALASPNVSVVVAQDGQGTAAGLHALYADPATKTTRASVGALGIVLGLLSKASVHESIAWVSKFPTGVALPAFADGQLLRNLPRATVKDLDKARYIFFTTYNGLSGSFVNDSHNMDNPDASDYRQIELVRTMDKAVRGIRTYLLPELGGPLYIDPETGRLAPETAKHLENVAGMQLEEMERRGELSGWKVEIDPNQNVLSSSTVEFVIRNVAVGVFRRGVVKIGYALSI